LELISAKILYCWAGLSLLSRHNLCSASILINPSVFPRPNEPKYFDPFGHFSEVALTFSRRRTYDFISFHSATRYHKWQTTVFRVLTYLWSRGIQPRLWSLMRGRLHRLRYGQAARFTLQQAGGFHPTISLTFFNGRILTTFLACLALNTVSSPVNGLIPFISRLPFYGRDKSVRLRCCRLNIGEETVNWMHQQPRCSI
jgi:hypothetical protein